MTNLDERPSPKYCIPVTPRTNFDLRSIFQPPAPIRRIFDSFPLTSLTANELPSRSPQTQDENTLHIFSAESGASSSAPSFNPACLKWQTYLKFNGIQFRVLSANNHASPSGVLPFLVPAKASFASPPSQPVPSNKISKWVKAQREGEEPDWNTQHEAYMSLIDHSVRRAWLFTLYVDRKNAEAVAKPLYVTPSSSNPLVRLILFRHLQQAAEDELLKTTSQIKEDELYGEAGKAFNALSALLGLDDYFFGSAVPTLFDASVFAYTHLLLDSSLGWRNTRLADALRKATNLVNHRQRIFNNYFGASDAI